MSSMYEEYLASWEEYEAQQTRLDALTRRVNSDVVDRLVQIASAEPHMSPGVVLAAAESGIDDDTVAYLAVEEMEQLNEDPLYRRIMSRAGAGGMFGLRSGLSALQGVGAQPFKAASTFLTASQRVHAKNGTLGQFNPANWSGELGQAWRDFGPMPIETQVGAVLRGEETDWRLTGDVWNEHLTRRQGLVTPGAFAANGIFGLADTMGVGHVFEQGTRAYDFTRMVVDLGFELGTDPTLYAGKTAQIAIAGRKSFAGVPAAQRGQMMGLIEGPRRTVLPEIKIDNYLSSREGALAMDWLSQTEDFTQIFQRVKNAEAAVALRDASTVDEVADVIRLYAGRGIEGPVSAPLGLRIERAMENTRLARIWDQATDLIPDMPNWTRFGKWTPKYTGMPLSQPDEAVEQFTRWFINWNAPKDMTSKLTERFARAVVAGDRTNAWGVWKQANDELAIHLRDLGHDANVTRALTRMIGGPDFSTGTNQRAYWMKQIDEPSVGLMRGHAEVHVEGTWWKQASPHLPVELMDEMISMPNLLEIRRATSMLTRITKVPRNNSQLAEDMYQVFFGIDPKITQTTGMKGVVWSTHDFLWGATTAIWMPMALVTRIAWPMRVTAEEQLRMGAVGLDAMFQHPLSYISWSLGNPETSQISRALMAAGVRQKGYLDILGDPIHQSRAFQQSLITNRPASYGGPGMPSAGSTGWDSLRVAGATPRQKVSAMRIEMGKLWKDDVAQNVAEAILRGDNALDSTYAWFYNSNLHRGMMRTSDQFSELLSTPQGVRAYLEDVAFRIRQTTGGDTELIESIVERSYRGIDVLQTNLDKRKINNAILDAVNRLESQNLLPQRMVVPNEVIAGTDRGNLYSRVVAQLFYMLGAVPTNVLSRSPVFRQMYYREMTRLIEFSDFATQKAILSGARAANVPKNQIDDMVRRMRHDPDAALPQRGQARRIQEAEEAGRVADIPDGRFVRSAEEADMIAKEYALRNVNTLLYQLTERGQTLAAMRLIFPFGEAWKEIGLTWSRLMASSPHNLRRGQIYLDGARANGFLYRDPMTGEESYTSPGPGMLTSGRLLGIPVFDPLPEGTRAIGTSPLQGVNLFAGSAIPGIGPVFNMYLGATLPDNTEAARDLRNFLLPFGSLTHDVSDLVNPDTYLNVVFPAWIKKALTAILEDGHDARMWRSHVADAARVLGASGEYGTSEDEVRRLADDAEALAKRTLWFRAIGQAILPTGYRVDFQVAPTDPAAGEMMRNLLGDDFEFGRDEGGFLSMTVLSSFYYQLLEEADGDTFLATQTFLEMFGTSPDNYDLYQWVGSLGTGKTVALTGRARDWKGRMWEENNSHLIDEIPAVIGMFAPIDDDADMDIAAFIREVELGDRYPLTGEQFIIASQKIIGTAIWRETVRQTDGINTPAARQFRAERQVWLDENFPYWRRDRTNVGVPAGYSWEDQMRQLERAVTFDEVLDTPQGAALQQYLEEREIALAAIEANFDDVRNREQAKIALRTRNATAQARSMLRMYGEGIADEVPEFRPIWDRILLRQVDDEE